MLALKIVFGIIVTLPILLLAEYLFENTVADAVIGTSKKKKKPADRLPLPTPLPKDSLTVGTPLPNPAEYSLPTVPAPMNLPLSANRPHSSASCSLPHP